MELGVTTVTIYGQEYSVRGGEDTEYVQLIAKYVDERMQEIGTSGGQITSLRVAILAALNITDELFQERDGLQRTRKEVRARTLKALKKLEKI